MKCAALVIATLSIGNGLSAVLQARGPEAESMRLARGGGVSDTETGLSVRRPDTGELTSVSPSGSEHRSGDGGLEKRWSTACLECIGVCLAGSGLKDWEAGKTFLARRHWASFGLCGATCVAEGACFGAVGNALTEAAQIFNEQKELHLTDAIGGSSPGGSPGP